MDGLENRRLVRITKALADPTRMRIFEVVCREAWLCCGDVGRRLPVTQATVSHHLRILAEAGLVESRRAGQQIQVRAVPETLAAYHAALGELVAAGTAAAKSPDDTAFDELAPPPAVEPTPPPGERDDSPAARRARRRAQLDGRYPPSEDSGAS